MQLYLTYAAKIWRSSIVRIQGKNITPLDYTMQHWKLLK